MEPVESIPMKEPVDPAVEELAAAMQEGNKASVIQIVKELIRNEYKRVLTSKRRKTWLLIDHERVVNFQKSLLEPYKIGKPIMDFLGSGKLDCYVPSAVCFYLQLKGMTTFDAELMMRKRLPCYLKKNKCYTDPTPLNKYESAYMDPKQTKIPVAFYCKTPVSLVSLGMDRLVDFKVLNVVASDSYTDRSSWNVFNDENEISNIFKLIEGATMHVNGRLGNKGGDGSSGDGSSGDGSSGDGSRWSRLLRVSRGSKSSSSQSSSIREQKKMRAEEKTLWKQVSDRGCDKSTFLEDENDKITTIYYFTNPYLLKTNQENTERAEIIKNDAASNSWRRFHIIPLPPHKLAIGNGVVEFKVNAYETAYNIIRGPEQYLQHALFVFEWNGASAMGHGVPPMNPSLAPKKEFFNSIGRHSAIAFLAMSIRQKYVGVPP